MPCRRLLLPLLVALPVLAVLLYLGTWQVERLGWKAEVLRQIAAAEQGPAQPLAGSAERFAKVRATGRFDHAREALLELEVRGPVLGARLLTPLLRDGQPPLLVDRGWVPVTRDQPIARPQGEVSVEGFIRPGEARNSFSATDDTAARRFFTFDPAAIGAAMGLAEVAPFGLVALGGPGGLPDPARSLPRPSNSHLGYAITWFGLALSLLGVFFVWARRRLKDPA
jgi:surfeit locus 1 family protein